MEVVAMQRSGLFFLFFAFVGFANAQSSSDSVTITFLAYQPVGNNMYVPGEFNNWGPNSSGVISPGAASQMTYDGALLAYSKTYTFKIHDPGAGRVLGDSVFMYKFNKGGSSTGWYPDPLNPEQNPNDNNNSVLRLTKLFFFQVYSEEVSANINRIVAGIVHANSDTIASVKFYTGVNASSTTMTDVSSSFDEGKRILNYTLPAPIPALNYIRLVATTTTGDSTVFQNTVYEVEQLPMPAYAKHGVTKASPQSGDSTTFRLRVPGKNFVVLRIAPSGQPVATADPIVMKKDPSSDNWWVNLKLDANTTYEYLYEIENQKMITDPFGRYVGTYGTQFSSGAEGLSADNYTWQTTGYQRPPLNKTLIYELNVGEFAGGYYGKAAGTAGFSDLKNLIWYFDSLGVNAIELMPVNDFGGVGKSGHSWGYDLNSYFAIEPGYGTPLQLKQLVDEAHKHGIAIILDVVFNHLNETGPLWQMLPDEAANPYFKLNGDMRYNEDALYFFKDMDHWTNETQELILECLKMWIDEYKIDGFRYDFTQGVGWNISQPTKGILGWANAVDTLYDGEIYQIAEHLPESPALIYYSGLTGGWHDSFRDEVFDHARFQNTTLAEFENLVTGLGAYGSNDTPASPSSYGSRTEPINATVTHDEQSLIYEMKQFQGVPESLAVVRDKLYASFIFGSLGVPMLWEGQEFSEPRGWASDGLKLTYRPVQFGYLNTQRGKDHFAYYHSLIMQRKLNPALYDGELKNLYKYNTEKVLVWGFVDMLTNSKVMLVANLSNAEKTVNGVPWLGEGVWYDVFNQSQFIVSGSTVGTFTVPAYTAKVYSNKSNDDLGIPTSVQRNTNTLPSEFALGQNFPNPFNPSTTINYQVPMASYVSLTVYDLLGREVATLVEGEKAAGSYSAVFDASRLASGVYFYKLKAGASSQVKRMSFVK